MTRWLVLVLGLALAAAGGYALLYGSGEPARPKATSARGGSEAIQEMPHAEIDEDSRARLEAILRDADDEEAP